MAGKVSALLRASSSFSGITGPATKGLPSSGTVGEVGLYRECRLLVGGVVAVWLKSSVVIGKGCIDLRRDDMVLFGFM